MGSILLLLCSLSLDSFYSLTSHRAPKHKSPFICVWRRYLKTTLVLNKSQSSLLSSTVPLNSPSSMNSQLESYLGFRSSLSILAACSDLTIRATSALSYSSASLELLTKSSLSSTLKLFALLLAPSVPFLLRSSLPKLVSSFGTSSAALHCCLSGGGAPVIELFCVCCAAAAISGAWR